MFFIKNKPNNKFNNSCKKKAMCVGINNYPGVKNDLRGCVNDALMWKDLLENVYEFEAVYMKNKEVTSHKFVETFVNLIADSFVGDSIVITFSGHGTNVADTSSDEIDGRDEALVLYDGYLIDDSIREILKNLHHEAKLTFISDSCHSGTVTRSFLSSVSEEHYLCPRYLPPEDPDEIWMASNPNITKNKILHPEEDMNEILISGCLPDEYSYDAFIGGKYHGAMSYYACKVLRQKPVITYEAFYEKLRHNLPSSRFPQTPQLEGSSQNKKHIMFAEL